MRDKKQENRILDYMVSGNGTISPLQSWRACGVYRLSDVIFKLRKQGFDIRTETTTVINRFGEECQVARYKLITD